VAQILQADDIFKLVIKCLNSSSISIRKEAIIVISNTIATFNEVNMILKVFDRNGDLMKTYLDGLYMISSPPSILSILDTLKLLCELDISE